ncbi:hypothetical protein MLD38_017045 [Melastoma candidum]|uniref:Uncharacterized protein n=1 Tax=Melastoma candidum TaxID=119954 RepID=A0ACB9QTF3_9MYRT|nr:hypothetical protein MLD38_017045 [Melastoma candidum]
MPLPSSRTRRKIDGVPGFASPIASSAHPIGDRLVLNRGRKMKFVMEFAENLILRLMEDPKERDRKFRESLYAVHDRCKKTKEMWSYPLRPYGFWTFERHNSQLAWDPQISQVPGRRDPYDDLLQQEHQPPK